MCSQPKHLSDIPQCKMCAYVFVREMFRCWELALGGNLSPVWTPEAAAEQESCSNKKVSSFLALLVVISRLNNLPICCWNAKKTGYKTTNVYYLFPFGASQQKQNNIIRTYVEFLNASNSSIISGCEVKAGCPLPFMKMGFECSPPVLNSVAQFFPCLPFLTMFKEI